MTFYVVTNPHTSTEVWLAWEDTAEVLIYTYVPNLGAFVRNSGLYQDFYWDMEANYRPVDAEEAARIVEEGRVGRLDARTHQRALLDRLSKIEDRKDPGELLGGSRVRPAAVSPRMAAAARAERVRSSAPGMWVTWKHYPSEHKQRAYQAATDLRGRKVKALAGIPIEVRLARDDQGRVLVQVCRASGGDTALEGTGRTSRSGTAADRNGGIADES